MVLFWRRALGKLGNNNDNVNITLPTKNDLLNNYNIKDIYLSINNTFFLTEEGELFGVGDIIM